MHCWVRIRGIFKKIERIERSRHCFYIWKEAAKGELVAAQKMITTAIMEASGIGSDEEDLADLLLLVVAIGDCDLIMKDSR